VHAERKQVCLHFDVDVISSEEIPGGDVADSGVLGLAAVREALESFARAPNLSAVSITEYNPERDPEAKAAAVITELFVAALAQRLVKKEPEEVKEVVAAEAAEPAAAAPAETISEALAEAPSTEEAALPAESPAPPTAEPGAEQAPPAAGQAAPEEGAVMQETAPPVLETAEPAAVETTTEQQPEPAVSSQPSEGTEAPQPEAEGEPSEAPKPPSE
jgi:hypothetical protein